jgi:hypothetical protein
MQRPEVKEKMKRPKSEEARKNMSKARKGINKGKTWEEIYGPQKATEMRENIRILNKEKSNKEKTSND